MKLKSLALVTLVATTLSVTSLNATAQPHGFGAPHEGAPYGEIQRKPHRGAMLKHVLRELDLSDEQKQKIKAIMESEKDDKKQNRQQMMRLKQQMHQLLMADNLDEGQLRNLAHQTANLKVDMMLEHRELFQQIKQELTQEQLDQLEEMREQRQERREKRRDRRANRGD